MNIPGSATQSPSAREHKNTANSGSSRRKGRYGIDAPYVPLSQIVIGLVCIVWAGLAAVSQPIVDGPLWLGLWGALWLAVAACYLHTTLRGKFVVWARLGRSLNLSGSEQVLDLGCGRGLVLLEVAKHLTTGTAVGIDLWHSRDQSGNARATTEANATAEEVAEHVKLETGDITALPSEDASFNVVVSALAIHNIRGTANRLMAVNEAVRVLRPGGRLLLADFRHTRSYAQRLRELGLSEVTRHSLGWRYWYGGPIWATYSVRARKP